jgi:hypothetical protein
VTDSTYSSAGEPYATPPDMALEAHELLTQVLPLLVAHAQERIALGARQAAWQQVDHVLDRMRRDLAEQTSDWLDQVSSIFREGLDRTLVSLGAEWCTQIERTFDPIRTATYRQVDQAVRATWGDGAAVLAADPQRRAAKETRADDAELVVGNHTRERKTTRRTRRSSSGASNHDGATAREKGTKEEEMQLSERGASERTPAPSRAQAKTTGSADRPASAASSTKRSPSIRSSVPRSGKASEVERSKEQANQDAVAEKPARRSSNRHSTSRSARNKPAARSPSSPRRSEARPDRTRTESSRRSRKEE